VGVIFEYPAAVLAVVCEPIVEVTEDHREFALSLLGVMQAERRTGLAAPQLGRPIRMIALVGADGRPLVLCNPVCTDVSRESIVVGDTCASIPGLTVRVARPARMVVAFTDLDGRHRHLMADASGTAGVAHCLDHLNGHLLVDRLGRAHRDLLRKRLAHRAVRLLA
jgi:peptide deformylase